MATATNHLCYTDARCYEHYGMDHYHLCCFDPSEIKTQQLHERWCQKISNENRPHLVDPPRQENLQLSRKN